VRSLVVEGGRVVGAEVGHDGKTRRVKATLGVLVATGGFERNQAMRERYQRHPVDAAWTVGHVDNTGDGIELGARVGAALDSALMREAWWAPTIVPPGESTAWVLVIEKSLPHSCFVDRNGKRFVNEAGSYNDVGLGMYEADAHTHAAVPSWLIFDATFRRKFPLGPIQPSMMMPDRKLPDPLQPGNGWLRRASSLEVLAASIDVDARVLRDTVTRFNDHARRGDDPDFGRGRTLNDRYYADPRVKPNPSLGAIEKPPFYAAPVVPGDLGTKAGLITDRAGHVLDQNDRPIPGLYGAGNVTSSVMGRAYPGAGATLAPAMTFAFIAAETIDADAEHRSVELSPT
jgi:3-oxosteroid 1-dehydrogenase